MIDPAVSGFVVACACALGACVGSFLNVCIHRLPNESLSIVHPPSHCPTCGKGILWYDNVPLVSWLALAGKCRACRSRISPRYVLVETLTAILFGLVALLWARGQLRYSTIGAVGSAWGWGVLAVHLYVVGSLLVATFVDLAHRIIPDEVTVAGAAAAPILCWLLPALQPWKPAAIADPRLAALIASLAGAVVGGASIHLVGIAGKAIFRKEAMGFGDVKFMAMVGAFLGPAGVLLTFLLGCLLGSVIGGVSLLVTGDRYTPFGPFLSAGAFAVLLAERQVVEIFFEKWPQWLQSAAGLGP